MEPTRFRYRALDAHSAEQVGTIDAASTGDASRQLQQRGLVPVTLASVEVEFGAPVRAYRRKRASPMDRIVLLRELGTLLESGVALSEALSSLALAYRGRGLFNAVTRIDHAVRNGTALSQAFAQSGIDLPAMPLALMSAGEATGRMASALLDASSVMENDLRLRRDLRNALTYPAVLVAAGLVAVLIIFVGVVPRFASILRNPRADLPALSRWVIETGVWAQSHLLWLALGSALVVTIALAALARPPVRRALFGWVASGPLLGAWLIEAQIGRWASGLSALLTNRVPIVDALRLSSSMTTLDQMSVSIQRCARDVEQGRTVSDSLRGASWLSPTALNLIRVGERSGTLDRMLAAVSRMNSESAANRQRQVLALIEPIAILIIAGVIAFIMVAVMMAITSMGNIAA
jgi:general secretion pathway protein F